MIRRLLLALLTLCLALPAAAMPLAHAMPAQHHAVAADHGHNSHHRQQQPDQAPAQHDCIGCVAPYAALGDVPDAPLPANDAVLPGIANALPGATAGPETPPPKP